MKNYFYNLPDDLIHKIIKINLSRTIEIYSKKHYIRGRLLYNIWKEEAERGNADFPFVEHPDSVQLAIGKKLSQLQVLHDKIDKYNIDDLLEDYLKLKETTEFFYEMILKETMGLIFRWIKRYDYETIESGVEFVLRCEDYETGVFGDHWNRREWINNHCIKNKINKQVNIENYSTTRLHLFYE